MRRPHRFWGTYFIIAGFFLWIPVGNQAVKWGGFFHAVPAYIIAAVCILGGIRLFTGMPLFRLSDFRKQEKPNAARWHS
jgi:hypothetical protein